MISLRYLLQLCDLDFMLLLFFLKSLLLWSPKCKCFSLATWTLDGHANTVTFLQRVSSDFGPLSPHVLSTQHLCLRSSPLVLSLLSQSLRSGFYSATPCSIPLPFPPPFSLLQVLPHLSHAGLNSQHGIHCHWSSLSYVSVYFLSCLKAWNVRMRQGQHSLSLQKRPRSSKTIQRLVCARHAERTLKSQTWKVWPWPLGNLLSNEAEKVSHKTHPIESMWSDIDLYRMCFGTRVCRQLFLDDSWWAPWKRWPLSKAEKRRGILYSKERMCQRQLVERDGVLGLMFWTVRTRESPENGRTGK